MIAVAEPPLEFIPRGRPTVEDHPGPAEQRKTKCLPSEQFLLQRLANVNISSTEDSHEFWSVREIYDDSEVHAERVKRKNVSMDNYHKKNNHNCKNNNVKSFIKGQKVPNTEKCQQKSHLTPTDALSKAYIVNNEEELYVNNNTVVWTQGSHEEDTVLKHMCLTCETPVKFAFFVSREFVRCTNEAEEEAKLTAICVIDQKTLRVYCDDGEDFITNLEFPVSNVWPTKFGLLLEKISGSAVVQNLTIPMPRLFSLAHPQDEMCPVLLKSATNAVGYMTEPEYHIIFSEEQTDLMLLYDTKIFKHFVSRLRKVTPEEVQQFISTQNESQLLSSHTLHRGQSFAHSSASNKHTGATPKRNSACLSRSATGALGGLSNYSAHMSRFVGQSASSLSGFLGHGNRTSLCTPLSNLQSTIGQHSISARDIRKLPQVKPAKPIEPVLCLEHMWTENTYGTQREFCEMAKRAFLHTDLVGQTFICYLLPRSCRLQLIRITAYGECNMQLSAMPATISAKDAVCLQRMHMIIVMDPNGSLIIYTGSVLISKVHITPGLTLTTSLTLPVPNSGSGTEPSATTVPNPASGDFPLGGKSPNAPFPRRSSLLPTVQKTTDATFEEELHLLSPVHPLPGQFSTHRQTNNVCLSLRDPAGNRVTLVYASGKMLRISLPYLNESKLITHCISTLRQVLNKSQFLQFIIRWYGARNPPGSLDFSTEQEWQLFKSILLSLMGCMATEQEGGSVDASGNTGAPHTGGTAASQSNLSPNTVEAAANELNKRRKYNDHEVGSDNDWEFMLNALGEHTYGDELGNGCPVSGVAYSVDTSALLFTMLPAIFYSFHLLYEDFKLSSVLHGYLPFLATFLHQLAIDMQLSSYILHYIMDMPELAHTTVKVSMLTVAHGAMMKYQELLHAPAPSVYAQLEYILRDCEVLPYRYVEGINELSRNVLQLVSLVVHGHTKIKNWFNPLEFHDSVQADKPKRPRRAIAIDVPRYEQVVQMLISMDITRRDIERLPVALHLIIAESLEQARLKPPIGSSAATYRLILRPELVEHTRQLYESTLTSVGQHEHKNRVYKEDSLSPRCPRKAVNANAMLETQDSTRNDGMDNIDTKLLRLRFPDDMRVEEVRRLLTSSEPVLVEVVQLPGTSDHEFIEEQEKQLFSLCWRTMTLPLGRGMFTLRTMRPRPVDNMPIPKLCMAGKEPTKGTTIEMQQIEYPPNMHMWPTFHNGVAAGLQISSEAKDIDSTWIVYNKPRNQTEFALEHAGFLMALGLNGHLKTLSFMSIYDYLVKCDEMTSVGLLLGISAAHRGTMDTTITKLLSVHIEALLPATALELDIPQSIQVAALMGIGLLYQGSAKRHIAEVLLQEIGRPPGPEMENSIERESYALTAGLSLGLVTLGQGESPAGLRDLQLPDTLHYYMVGGAKRPLTGSQKEKYRLASFQVREGDNVNIDVTAPGATLALGLMFFNSGNVAIADWFNPPNTRYMLDLVRPDFLLLRTISRGLIMWHEIDATSQWLQSQFPAKLQPHLNVPKQPTGMRWGFDNEDVDYEIVAQAYCNIIAGAAFCIGLKYAGTEDPTAFKTLRATIKEFLGVSGKPLGEYAGRTTVESCLMVLLVSISLVFAGSGDCEILRIIRYLRSRVGNQYPHVTYGSHMAIHMSLGLLFLGAGRFTIAKTPQAIAALVCAFFPKYPIHSNDNRYHLQAFRHLYVLAVEPRLFLPRDIDTHQLCLCHVTVLEVGATEMRRLPIAPCMLPELNTLQKVVISDENYWPVCFERGRNWDQLVKVLSHSACIDIKKRTGCLSHLEDPDRLKSMLAQTLTKEQFVCWQVDIKDLQRFGSERLVMSFVARFFECAGVELSYEQMAKRHQLTLLFYNAVIKDKMHALPIYMTYYNHVAKLEQKPTAHDIWQLKLIDIYMSCHRDEPHGDILISTELMQMLNESFKLFLDAVMQEHCIQLRHFVTTDLLAPNWLSEVSLKDLRRILAVANFYNFTPNLLHMVDLSTGTVNYLRILFEFKKLKLNSQAIYGLIKILQATSNGFI